MKLWLNYLVLSGLLVAVNALLALTDGLERWVETRAKA